MVPRRLGGSSATLTISLSAAVLGTIAVASLLTHRAASVLVQSWAETDEASVARLLWKQSARRQLQMQMLAVSPKPLGTYTDDCGSGGR